MSLIWQPGRGCNIKRVHIDFLTRSKLKNIFVRLSAILFAWYLFGFMSYFPGIDGLNWKTAIRIAVISSFCAFGLWFTTMKLAARSLLLKLILLIPSLIFFPIVSYALDPIFFGVAILSLVFAIQNVISGGRPAAQTSERPGRILTKPQRQPTFLMKSE